MKRGIPSEMWLPLAERWTELPDYLPAGGLRNRAEDIPNGIPDGTIGTYP